MPKKRDKNPEEFWKGKWREADKENRNLRKRLKQLEQKEHIFDDNVLDGQDEEVALDSEDTFLKKGPPCGECGKGRYEEFHILDKIIGTCNICGDRKRLK